MLLVYREFIFGDAVFLYKDLGDDGYISMYPQWQQKIDMLAAGKLPSWSFATAMGENTYPFWFEPISLSILLLFFKQDVAYGFIWIQIAHTFLSGLFFFLFLRSFRLHPWAVISSSLLYAFSGYLVTCGAWMTTVFATETTLFSFLLFALAKLYANENKIYYALAIAYCGVIFPFYLYFAGIISLIYFLALEHYHAHLQLSNLWKKAGNIVKYGAIGLGLSAFCLLSNINTMLQSPRGNAEGLVQNTTTFFSWLGLKTSLLRLFSTHILGGTHNFEGYSNYFESPILYAGLLPLLIIPAMFTHFPKRIKTQILLGYSIFLLLFAFPILRHAIWLFAGDYFRTLSLFFILFTLTVTAISLHYFLQNAQPHKRSILISFALYGIVLLIFQNKNASPSPSWVFILLILLIYTIGILYFRPSSQNIGILICLLSIEIFVFSQPPLYERKICQTEDIVGKNGYKDNTLKALTYIKNKESVFFRIEKDYFSARSQNFSFNDAKIQGFYGIKSYQSFHNQHFITFLTYIGALKIRNEWDTRWIKGIEKDTLAMSLCNVKYLLSVNDSASHLHKGYKWIHEINGIHIYEIPRTLPLGYTYANCISEADFLSLSLAERRKKMLNTVCVSHVESLPKDSLPASNLAITYWSDDHIEGNIQLLSKRFLFLSIPFDAGWTMTLNEKPVQLHKAFGGLMGCYIEAGNYKVVLHYEDPYLSMGGYITLFSLILLLFTIFYPMKSQA